VMRTRLRERHPDEAAFYRERYPTGYHHTEWPDHVERVAETVRFAAEAVPGPLSSVADLSCGDGDLAVQLADCMDARTLVLGDVNPESVTAQACRTPPANGWWRLTHYITGSLPESLAHYPDGERAGLFVCSETLEHLDDPDAFLSALRPVAERLLLTTPVGEATDGNPEHYWGWDCEGVAAMLDAAGFTYVMGHQVFTPIYRTPDVIPTQMWMVA
jgi:SAM-dependent methyltransferase